MDKNNIKVLVSGASGIIGYGILRSLKKSRKNLQLIGTTIYDDSVAEGFCDIFEKAPMTSDSNYIDWLLKMIKKHTIDVIIPGIEADMYAWSEHSSILEASGVKLLINNKDLISICKDKWQFSQILKNNNSSYLIDTSISNNFDQLVESHGLPFLLKPRSGHGSKGIVIINNRFEFQNYQNQMDSKLMAQTIVGNDNEEFTTSAFCDGKGSFYASMSFRRKLSKDGYTQIAKVENIEEIDIAVQKLCTIFKPIGPTNFQFRRHHKNLKLLEINPRISSSTSMRTKFGYNESEMSIQYLLENKTPTQPLMKQGRAVRYIEDLIFYT